MGNTYPGACYPLGMVSVCAHSGAHPTGYGMFQMSMEGIPSRLYDRPQASGFTYFQQPGPGAKMPSGSRREWSSKALTSP